MAFYKPRSIVQLTFIGFALVALPLMVAVVIILLNVHQLADESRRTVYRTTSVMRASREMIDQLIAMERSARQSVVMEDEELFGVYLDRRKEFDTAVRNLNALVSDTKVISDLTRLVNQEVQLFNSLQVDSNNNDDAQQAVAGFRALVGEARVISHQCDRWIDEQANIMRLNAMSSQRFILILSTVLGAIALLLTGLFAAFIARPLRSIDGVIRSLGSGSSTEPIKVPGPLDTRALGERLEWLRTRLAELEQQRLSFLRHVSHDLKTPLTAIMEGTDLLGDHVLGRLSPEQTEIVHILRKNGLQLKQLIEDLLRFNVTESQRGEVNALPVRLDEVVEDVLATQSLAIKADAITVKTNLAALTIEAHPEQARVIVDNIISNAVKYSPGGGTIGINLTNGRLGQQAEDSLSISSSHGSIDSALAVLDVMDQGIGIPQQERERVFDLFYQGDQPAKNHLKGSGIGLAIVQEYMRMNRGFIEILDADVGTHFRLSFILSKGSGS